MYRELLEEFTKLAENLPLEQLEEKSIEILANLYVPAYDSTAHNVVDATDYMNNLQDEAGKEGYLKGLIVGVSGLRGTQKLYKLYKNYKNKKTTNISKSIDVNKNAEFIEETIYKFSNSSSYTEALNNLEKLAEMVSPEELEIITSDLIEKEAFGSMLGAGISGAIKGVKQGVNANKQLTMFNNMYGTPVFNRGKVISFNDPSGRTSKNWSSLKRYDQQQALNQYNQLYSAQQATAGMNPFQAIWTNAKGGYRQGQTMKAQLDLYNKNPNLVPKNIQQQLNDYYGYPITNAGSSGKGSKGNSGSKNNSSSNPNIPAGFIQTHPYLSAALAAGAGMMIPRMIAPQPQPMMSMPMMTPPMMYYR